MSRIADRPATHAGPQLHEFDGNRHRRTDARFPIDYYVRWDLPAAFEFAIGCGLFSRHEVFHHFKSMDPFFNYLAKIVLFLGLDCRLAN